MTEKETIEYIITTRKFPRMFDDYMNYFFLAFPLSITVIGGSTIYNYIKFDSGATILILSVLFIALGVPAVFFVLRRLKANIAFKCISAMPEDNLDNVAERLNQTFNLRRIDVNKDLNRIIAFTKPTAFSWGEQLTLVFDKDCILINSRPSGSTQPLTIVNSGDDTPSYRPW